MNISTEKNIMINFEDIEDYKFPLDNIIRIDVMKNNIKYPFIIKFSSNDNYIFSFGDNFPLNSNKKFITPNIDKQCWYNSLEDSFIVYLDPTYVYSEKLLHSTFIKAKNQQYSSNLWKIIEKLSKNRQVINKKFVFIGKNKRCMSSLFIGTKIKNSKVIISNLDVSNFEKLCQKFDFIESNSKNTFTDNQNLISLFQQEKFIPDITFLVNTKSEKQFNYNQLIETITNLDYYDNNLNLKFYSDSDESDNEAIEIEIRRIIYLISKGINQKNSTYQGTDKYNELCKYNCNKRYIVLLENKLIILNKTIKNLSQKNKFLFKKNSNLLNENHELRLRSKRYEQKIVTLKETQKENNSSKLKLKNLKKYF